MTKSTNLMPEYLLHPNGRGKLMDDAEANRSTYIDVTSRALGFAKLRDCELRNGSQAAGHSQIYGGKFYASSILGETICAGSPDVSDSILICSEVSGSPVLDHVHAVGNTEICDTPELVGTESEPLLLTNAIIYGSPCVHGDFKVTGRVHEGTWTRAPKHIKLPWCDLSECIDGKMLLNCWCRPVEWWLRFGPQKARDEWSWSEDQIEITVDRIRENFYTEQHGRRISVSANASQPQEERSVSL